MTLRRVAIVTGGGSGIGLEIGRMLARDGVTTILTGRTLSKLEAAAAELRALPGAVRSERLDVTDAAAVRELVDRTVRDEGGIDYLFNNAGIAILGEARDLSIDDWRAVIDVNLRGVVHGVVAVYPHMVARGSGHIVNVSSLSGIVPMPAQAPYVAAKSAVVGMSHALRIEGAPFGVKVSVACPAMVETPIFSTSKWINLDAEAARNAMPDRGVSAKSCAETIMKGVSRNAPTITTGVGSLLRGAQRLVPGATRMVARRTRTMVEQNRAQTLGDREPSSSSRPAPNGEPRVAIVTGAASGIGLALTRQLTAEGATVVLVDNDGPRLHRETAELAASGRRVEAVEVDVADYDGFRKAIERTFESHGRLDYLFNNAGTAVLGESRDVEPSDWQRIIDVNLMGVVHGVSVAYPRMVRQGFGHIVNTASMSGLVPMPAQACYVTSKFGVVGLSRALRLEGEPHGVRVSVVCPASVATRIFDNVKWVKIDATKGRNVMPDKAQSAEDCAAEILRGIRANKELITPGAGTVIWNLHRFAPFATSLLAHHVGKKVTGLRDEWVREHESELRGGTVASRA